MTEYNWGDASGDNSVTVLIKNDTGSRPAPPYRYGSSTVSNAVNNYLGALTSGNPLGTIITNQLVASGLVRPGANISKLQSAYSKALALTSKVNASGNTNYSVFDAMAALGGGGTSGGGGGGGAAPQAATYKDFTKYTKAQIKSKAIAAYQAVLGRQPTAKEINAFSSALISGAKAAPSVTRVSASGKTRKTTAGFDENAFIAGYMSNHLPKAGELDGIAGDVQDLIDSYKENYGINPTNSFIQGALKTVIGSADQNGAVKNLEQQMKEQAQILFPALSEKINAGMTVRSIADPYISTYAKLMEKSDIDVGLDNKYIRSALSNKNDKGEYTLMTEDDHARAIRNSQEWLDTRNAKETMLSAADSILQQFGFKR